jgi:hypothetical protein
MSQPSPFSLLKKAICEDQDYARTWHDNLACCAMDEGISHSVANRIATRIMKLTFEVDTHGPTSDAKTEVEESLE